MSVVRPIAFILAIASVACGSKTSASIDAAIDAAVVDGAVDAGPDGPPPSNVGTEFWAVQLDQQAGGENPVTAPWGVALSNTGSEPASVTIEINTAPVGEPPALEVVQQLTVNAGELTPVILPMRPLDCGEVPNSFAAPGTCLSSRAYRITSSGTQDNVVVSADKPVLVAQILVSNVSFSRKSSRCPVVT